MNNFGHNASRSVLSCCNKKPECSSPAAIIILLRPPPSDHCPLTQDLLPIDEVAATSGARSFAAQHQRVATSRLVDQAFSQSSAIISGTILVAARGASAHTRQLPNRLESSQISRRGRNNCLGQNSLVSHRRTCLSSTQRFARAVQPLVFF